MKLFKNNETYYTISVVALKTIGIMEILQTFFLSLNLVIVDEITNSS